MYFKQFYLGCLAHASYLIGSEGEAAVVDPQRDVDEYIAEAEAHGLEIKYVIETHLHADFVSGTRSSPRAPARRSSSAKKPTPRFDIALCATAKRSTRQSRAAFLETPGHTPEGICVSDYRHEVSDQPQKILTGDTLFIGDVGRPISRRQRLHAADDGRDDVRHALHGKLLKLPDEVEVYPAHGAGSMCGETCRRRRRRPSASNASSTTR
jgi:glyoxylase-like metal-dependent hydrolase (beta-lactamase superfamily II)